LKFPKYVEKLHYYEDEPLVGETEAISIDRMDENYYRPFENKHLIFQAKNVYNCESIMSPFVCQESSLCGWDNLLNSCFFTNEISHDIRFKEQNKKSKTFSNKSTKRNLRRKFHFHKK
jgi:hypothetical protein